MHKQLLATASALAKRTQTPIQADLKRAVSTAYYAMFHALCETCANALVGTKSPDRPERAWSQTYRAVEHGATRSACDRCKSANYQFPTEIQQFSDLFITMQAHRHNADYDPNSRFNRATTLDLIDASRLAIDQLLAVDPKHKKAFAAMVLLKKR